MQDNLEKLVELASLEKDLNAENQILLSKHLQAHETRRHLEEKLHRLQRQKSFESVLFTNDEIFSLFPDFERLLFSLGQGMDDFLVHLDLASSYVPIKKRLFCILDALIEFESNSRSIDPDFHKFVSVLSENLELKPFNYEGNDYFGLTAMQNWEALLAKKGIIRVTETETELQELIHQANSNSLELVEQMENLKDQLDSLKNQYKSYYVAQNQILHRNLEDIRNLEIELKGKLSASGWVIEQITSLHDLFRYSMSKPDKFKVIFSLMKAISEASECKDCAPNPIGSWTTFIHFCEIHLRRGVDEVEAQISTNIEKDWRFAYFPLSMHRQVLWQLCQVNKPLKAFINIYLGKKVSPPGLDNAIAADWNRYQLSSVGLDSDDYISFMNEVYKPAIGHLGIHIQNRQFTDWLVRQPQGFLQVFAQNVRRYTNSRISN